jgi:hypothetical protein
MRATLLAAFTLTLATLAILPQADATAGPVCLPPGTLNQVCAGTLDGKPCVWFSGASPLSPICADTSIVSIQTLCVPPGTLNGMCIGTMGDAVCAWIYGGPAYHYVCIHADGTIEACSNTLFSALYGAGRHCLGDALG